MKGLLTYFKERFPIPVVALLSLGMAAMLVGIVFPLGNRYFHEFWDLGVLVFGGLFFFFLLRTRVTDEFKDATHDSEKYPNRPVQRGVIKRWQLVVLGIIALAGEIVCLFWLGFMTWVGGNYGLYWYLAILGYSMLTAFEFFVGEWLKKHFNLYFVLHQLIFVLFAGLAFSLFDTDQFRYNLLAGIGFVLYMAVVEIARKYELRFDSSGVVVRDTYLEVWGKAGSLLTVTVVSGLASWFFYLQKHSFWPLAVEAVLLVSLWLVHKRPKLVQGVIFLNFMVQAAVVYLA